MEAGIDLPTRYDASQVEQKWYDAWERAGLFAPSGESGRPIFSITIPPPNITGSLHMGHALCYPIQDLLGRYRRMRGHDVLILPGQDHAGIATQSVVGKQLKSEGISPSQLGRERFVERVWEWRRESGDTILGQLRRLGCAFDWSRSRFTLDDAYIQAVLKVFVEWFDRGLIYKGWRVVNWDPILRTSVSDIETERRTVRGKLFHIRYPFADGSGYVVIATTRPETMLADVAVAVHPSDGRYKGLVGKTLVLPLLNREIPLIADTYPDPAFGTGAVKITPAHDANDYEVGVRHGLPMPILLDPGGRIAEAGGRYAGMDRLEARKHIVADLEESGLLERVEDHDIPLLVSERSGEPIEPLLSEEWFVNQRELAQPVIAATRAGKIKFAPDRYERIFLEWLENIRDWNISRKLWWGHRIPVYYAEDGTPFAAMSRSEAEEKAGRPIVSQDEDVLDTWFSSGSWPFATLGWPEQTEDLARYYPTSVLVTSREILYLWVARMAMMGLDFVGETPFRDVYIYATVLTEDGKRMSKSLGTGVDPIGVIDRVGADALRWTLFSQTGHNQDIRYSERRTDDARNFCNKIWNATRFVLMHVAEPPPKPQRLEPVDRWLLSRLASTERSVRGAYEAYDLQEASGALYRFFWSELADWYVEISKGRLISALDSAAPKWVLVTALDAFLRMLHPLMPFLTEELFQHLPIDERPAFLMGASWPEIPSEFSHPGAEADVERAIAITRALRALRAEVGIGPLKPIPLAYFEGDLRFGHAIVAGQAWVQDLREGNPERSKCVSTTAEGVDLHLPIEGLVDAEREIERLHKELDRLELEVVKVRGQLDNPRFVERAKPEVVAKLRSQAETLSEHIVKANERIRSFGG